MRRLRHSVSKTISFQPSLVSASFKLRICDAPVGDRTLRLECLTFQEMGKISTGVSKKRIATLGRELL